MNLNVDTGTRAFRAFMLAIVACFVFSMVLRAVGVLPSVQSTEQSPESSFYEQ